MLLDIEHCNAKKAFALALAKVTHLIVTLFSLCVLAYRPHRSQLNAHSRREVYRDHPAQRASLLAEPLTSGDGGCTGMLFEKIAGNSPEMASVCFFF